ncbi:type II toxin-antitoxin system HicA family toxin [Methanogenium sp. MK-MG]|nr:type II toxin-antitoxin system HicA family toxin [Methanogenium sp. MK-MG]
MSPVKAEKVIKVLEDSGFFVVRQKGSHIILTTVETGADGKPALA